MLNEEVLQYIEKHWEEGYEAPSDSGPDPCAVSS